jgi:hypothetical protein
MFTSIKQKALTAGAFSLLSLSSLALSASPTYAAAIDFSTWTKVGDVTSTAGQATITTAGSSALETGGGVRSLEAALGIVNANLASGSTDTANTPYQGSGITNRSFFGTINANDVFSFNSNFTQNGSDRAFVAITNLANSATEILTPAASSFSYTFTTAGAYDVSIGALDVGDYIGESPLVVSNGNLQPVPEPISVISSIVAISCGATLRKRFGKKA